MPHITPKGYCPVSCPHAVLTWQTGKVDQPYVSDCAKGLDFTRPLRRRKPGPNCPLVENKTIAPDDEFYRFAKEKAPVSE